MLTSMLIWILLMTCILMCNGQSIKLKLKKYAVSAPTIYLVGASNGLDQTLAHHYGHFQNRHPGANPKYWNPNVSWAYIRNDGLFSTSLRWTQDGSHLNRSIGRVINHVDRIYVPRLYIKGQAWYWHVADFAFCSLVESAGFHTVYSGIYR